MDGEEGKGTDGENTCQCLFAVLGLQQSQMNGSGSCALVFMFARHGRALTGASPEHAQIVGSV